MATMYRLYDLFNRHTISRHRTYAAAEAAMDSYSRGVVKHHGKGSYIPMIILEPGEEPPPKRY